LAFKKLCRYRGDSIGQLLMSTVESIRVSCRLALKTTVTCSIWNAHLFEVSDILPPFETSPSVNQMILPPQLRQVRNEVAATESKTAVKTIGTVRVASFSDNKVVGR
jgi:hypothetical protein